MGINPLDPASNAGRPDRDVTRGHGTRALGPSDSSDSGSDIAGIPGAGSEIGDANLDSDSDRAGTGERSAATPDAEMGADGADIDADHIEEIPEADEAEDDEEGP